MPIAAYLYPVRILAPEGGEHYIKNEGIICRTDSRASSDRDRVYHGSAAVYRWHP